MPSLFWSGKLTLPMKVLVEANNLLSLLNWKVNSLERMKERVKRGYEGKYSDHVRQYDEYGYHLQDRSARAQLEGLSFDAMRLLDVGCGTGAVASVTYEKGAAQVVCGDIASFMLQKARARAAEHQHDHSLCQLDADSLPYAENSFDAVISGMTFGTLPNQALALDEMIRVVKPGGMVCVGAHGTEHYWEAIDASFRCINKRYILGYRLEWWPRDEKYIRKLCQRAGLENNTSRRVLWRNKFKDGFAAYDFFAAISASWWYAMFPPDGIAKDSQRTRDFFQRKNIRIVTDDIVVAYGFKPASH